MQPGELAVRIYPRQTREAIDLGLQMARRWWLPLATAWMAMTLPLLLLFWLLLDKPLLAALLVWWLKPCFDMVLLQSLSRRVFGETIALRTATGVWREVGWWRMLLAITLRRFDMQRSFTLPVTVLENLSGKVRRQRLAVLLQQEGSHAVGLTVAGSMAESLLTLVVCQTVFLLLPFEYWTDLGDMLFGNEQGLQIVQALAFWCAMWLVAPFYVAAGFAMYLNQRALLEGWDIELSFRQLQARLAGIRPAGAGQVVLLGMAGSTGGVPADALADTVASTGSVAGDAMPADLRQLEDMSRDAWQARQIVDDPALHDIRTTYWPRGWADSDRSNWRFPDWLIPDWSWLDQAFLLSLSRFFLAAMWVLAACLALWLVWRYRQVLPYVGRLRPVWRRRAGRVQLFDLDISPASLPDDVAATALALWQQQQYRAALSLLYRASLSRLVHEHHLELPDSATEGEVVQLLQRQEQAQLSMYFGHLTAVWQQLAYAHRLPDEPTVRELCALWRQVFDGQEPAA